MRYLPFVLLLTICACSPNHYRITDVQIYGTNSVGSYQVAPISVPIFDNSISFYVKCQIKLISGGWGPDGPAIDFDNRLIDSSFVISLDRPFIFDGDSVLSNQDLLRHPIIKNEITIKDVTPDRIILFSDDFVKKSSFDTVNIYTVSLSCKTSDSVPYHSYTQVKFKW